MAAVTKVQAKTNHLQEGTLLGGRFRVLGDLGAGGMGSVYRVLDTSGGSECALKLLDAGLTEGTQIARFKREFRAASRLRHPGCVQVHELGQHEDRWFFTMEFVTGGRLPTKRMGSVDNAVSVGLQTLAALDHIHAKQIVHRDIKPPNILCTTSPDDKNSPLQVKLSDFGIAKVSDAEDSAGVGYITGSLRYMSPEQAQGEQGDPRTDLYSLGIILYELLTGHHPLSPPKRADAATWLNLHRRTVPTPMADHVPDVPKELERIILRLLEKEPDRRPVTASEAYDELASWARSSGRRLSLPELPPLQRSAYLAVPRFVGRAKEMRSIEEFLGDAWLAPTAPNPVLLLLSGEAGVGKSRISAQIVRLAESMAALIQPATCRAEPGAPYDPVRLLLDTLGSVSPHSVKTDAEAPTGTDGPRGGTARPTPLKVLALGRPTEPAAVARQRPSSEAGSPAQSADDEGTLQASDRGAAAGAADVNGSEEATAQLSSSVELPEHTEHQSGRRTRSRDVGTLVESVLKDGPAGQSPSRGQSERKSAGKTEGALWNFHRRIADRLLALASRGSILILLEDAQWADGPTLELLGFLVRSVTHARASGKSVPVAFVITHRPAPEHIALSDLETLAASHAALLRIALAPLDADSADELVGSMLMMPVDERVTTFTRRLLQVDNGNPLYLGQILHALLAQGKLFRSSDGWNIGESTLEGAQLPTTIRDAIGDRGARFNVDTKRALAAAAVIGRGFELAALQSVTGLEEPVLLDSLDEAIRNEFLEEAADKGGSYRFVHDRLREALYESIPRETAAGLHRAVAEELEERAAGKREAAADLAHHYGSCGEPKKAFDYSVKAADFAMETYAFTRAADLYGKSVALAREAEITPSTDVIEHYGDACLEAGQYDHATENFTRCIDAREDPLSKAEVLRKIAEIEMRRGNTLGAAKQFEILLQTIGFSAPSKATLMLRMLGNFVIFLSYLFLPKLLIRKETALNSDKQLTSRIAGRLAEALYFNDFMRTGYYQLVALNTAERVGPSRELTTALAQQGYIMGTLGMYELAFRYLDRARAVGEAAGSPTERSWEAVLRSMIHGAAGRPALHSEIARQAEALLENSPEPMRLGQAWFVNAEALLFMGRVDAATRLATRLLHLAEEVKDVRGHGWAEHQLGRIAAWHGDYAKAIEHQRKSIDLLDKGGDAITRLMATARLTLLLALVGELDEAVELGLKGSEEQARLQLRHPSCVIDGATLAAAALKRRRDGTDDRSLASEVAKVKKRGAPLAKALRYGEPLYRVGCGAWDVACGKTKTGEAEIARGLEVAEQHELFGEIPYLHLVAARAHAADDDEFARHEELAKTARDSTS